MGRVRGGGRAAQAGCVVGYAVDGGSAGQLQRGFRADAGAAAVAACQWPQPAGLAQPRCGRAAGAAQRRQHPVLRACAPGDAAEPGHRVRRHEHRRGGAGGTAAGWRWRGWRSG
ncbi:hypothetical protein G6F59_017132 [Rhizopus arrhizus]|nr:hypothetical protein G6F59_017132 [Rhizopus arrhizus]